MGVLVLHGQAHRYPALPSIAEGSAAYVTHSGASASVPKRVTGLFSLLAQNRSTFLARGADDVAYLALTLSQTQLEFRATGSRARTLSLYSGRCCGKRCGARIGTGAK
jgi:hypothetical protein